MTSAGQVLKDYVTAVGVGTSRISVQIGEQVLVNWEKSNHAWIWCKSNRGGGEGLIPLHFLRLLDVSTMGIGNNNNNNTNISFAATHPTNANLTEGKFVCHDYEDQFLYFRDTLFPSYINPPNTLVSSTVSVFGSSSSTSASLADGGSFSLADAISSSNSNHSNSNPSPPVIEQDLDSFVWPLNQQTFTSYYWKQKAICVHSTAERLDIIKQDFFNLNIDQLINSSSHTVVWMATKPEGFMQHFYSPDPATAIHCYLAGHTLYFNPPEALQRHWIRPLCKDLGLDFGLEKDLGSGTESSTDESKNDGFGGDIEIFAVRGTHLTDWHFDAQENFTIQLKGTKKWSFAPSGIRSPVTNCVNDGNIARKIYHDQKKVHYGTNANSTIPPGKETLNMNTVRTVTLRPGSVLYIPAGWWHKVVCEEESGSLSMNFSITTLNWIDLFVNVVSQHLYKFPHWRDNIITNKCLKNEESNGLESDKASTIEQDLSQKFEIMKKDFEIKVEQIQGSDVIFPGLFLKNRKRGREGNVNFIPKMKKQKLNPNSSSSTSTNQEDLYQNEEWNEDKAFRKSLLTVLVKGSKPGLTVNEEEEKEDEESEENNSEEEEEKALKERKKKKRRIETSSSSSSTDTTELIEYTIHFGFGNRDIKSMLEVGIKIRKKWEPAIDWLREHLPQGQVFKLKHLFSILSSPPQSTNTPTNTTPSNVSANTTSTNTSTNTTATDFIVGEEGWEDFKRVIRVLCWNGFLSEVDASDVIPSPPYP